MYATQPDSHKLTKLPKKKIKGSRYLEAGTENHIGILSFCQNLCKILVKEFIFGKCRRLWASSFITKGTLSQTFVKDFACRFSWQNYRTAILKRTFSIKTLAVVASVYVYNILKDKRSKHIKLIKKQLPPVCIRFHLNWLSNLPPPPLPSPPPFPP